MRQLVPLCLLLTAGLWYACQVKMTDQAQSSTPQANTWVRTINGWQRPSDWSIQGTQYHPRLHPLVVALVQGLLSLLALLAFPSGKREPEQEKAHF
jgi:hypothetical protein